MKNKMFLTIASLCFLIISSSTTYSDPTCEEYMPKKKKVKIKHITTRSAKLSFKKVQDDTSNLKHYRIKVYNKKTAEEVYKTKIHENLTDDKLSKTIHQLQPATRYIVELYAVCNDSTQSAAIYKKFKTDSAKNASNASNVYNCLAHLDVTHTLASPAELAEEFDAWDIEHSIFTPTPGCFLNPKKMLNDGSEVSEFFNGYSQISVLYGGVVLNPILLALGGSMDLTVEAIHPNGIQQDTSLDVAKLQDIANDPAKWETFFKTKATEAAQSGYYKGFGELSPWHESKRVDHPQIRFPADQDLMKWLVDLCEQYNMFLLLHLEPTEETNQELENLLDYNPNVKIIMDHIGWYTTDYSTVKKYKKLLKKHANLYMSIKMRTPEEYTKSRPLKENGKLRKSWKKMLKKYKTQFVVTSDSKFWTESFGADTVEKELISTYEYIQIMLDQLPKKTAKKIARKNAETLLGTDN